MGQTTQHSQQLEEAVRYIQSKLNGLTPAIGMVLGSGLGDLAHEVEQAIAIPYSDIPHFPVSTVEGHAGQFVVGKLEGKAVIVMQGRFHYYEGYPFQKVVFPIYVMKLLGVTTIVITNAAGGMNRAFRPGDLMLISDHINLTGDHPLIGRNDPKLGVRFPDMSEAYDREYRALAHRLSSQIRGDDGDQLELQEGVYCGISGPAYMTPAELKMLVIVGGDAVGMSTVGEVIVARHAGLRVLGISCITDMAIGDELEPLTHEQVMAVANKTKPKFIALVKAFVREV
ncbi:purine-nucleoside phosphorylase [Paenibacillus koleovorans]|uniref:purine-nucleoside phosphorylase n=1 Tax=Paenibacillus koleovorans TaxID=121608 RepID=UPI000FD6D297|nr:purine-nucleoside phosphorylase [Paenibacillus koleovorans]